MAAPSAWSSFERQKCATGTVLCGPEPPWALAHQTPHTACAASYPPPKPLTVRPSPEQSDNTCCCGQISPRGVIRLPPSSYKQQQPASLRHLQQPIPVFAETFSKLYQEGASRCPKQLPEIPFQHFSVQKPAVTVPKSPCAHEGNGPASHRPLPGGLCCTASLPSRPQSIEICYTCPHELPSQVSQRVSE